MILLGIAIGILSIIGIVYLRIVTTFFHELGHAIPALFFTKGDVNISVGSYGFGKSNLKLKIGRLKIRLNFNIWQLNIGMCAHEGIRNDVKTLLIILGGPLVSLLSGFILLYFILGTSLNEGVKFVFAILFVSAIIDFVVNIIPRRASIEAYNGRII